MIKCMLGTFISIYTILFISFSNTKHPTQNAHHDVLQNDSVQDSSLLPKLVTPENKQNFKNDLIFDIKSTSKLSSLLLPVERPEPNYYFYPKGQDNTEPLDDNNILKDLPKNGCHEETKLLVGIRTAPVDFEERIWIRNNWGRYKTSNTSVIFLIGHHKNSSITNRIAEEQSKHQDLLLMNFDDHYRNLSLKNYALFKYYLDYCPNAKCLLKPDVDTVTNILGFEKICNVMSGSIEDQKMISGYVQRKQSVIRIPGNKWYVPRYVFPKEEYEEWAWGWGFLISGKNTVKDLVDTLRNKTSFLTSENYRRLPDDAIQTGDVRVLANISIQNPGGFGLAGKISLWKETNSNNSIPLMVEAVSNKEGIWKEVQKFMDSSKKS